MSKVIVESGMSFVTDNVFHIEKSPLYIQLGECVKSVEFVRSMGNKLVFVEAKSSFPNPNNPTPNPGKRNKTGIELFREEIADLSDKFIHSLNLYSSVDVGVAESRFPPEYMPSTKVTIMFVLVINSFDKSWCDEVERALLNTIRESICVSRIWKPEIYVLTHEMATKWKLTID